MPDYEITNPRAEALIESLRAFGYSLSTALADIIDNSITAEAGNVWLDFHWAGPSSWISITDDGKGMSEAELVNAMRPGSISPVEVRNPSDLGRFGLGLKTASFSQCRQLSVVTKHKGGGVSRRCWDLDVVVKHDQWRLLKRVSEEAESTSENLADLDSGTVVMLGNLDRVVGSEPTSDELAHESFLAKINEVRAHLEMIFHRFLESPNPILKIWINGTTEQHCVKPWDPFMEGHICTNPTPLDDVNFGGEVVNVKGYVLPHKDKLDDNEYQEASGPRGWNSHQGFYVYRNNRMLVSGSWLGLGRNRAWRKEEQYKLARLSIDIPNSMDSEWSLDVKKSAATPPRNIRGRLGTLAEGVRADARRVFAHRGEYGPRSLGSRGELERPWVSSQRNGHTIYRISRSHPLVEGILFKIGGLRPELEALLRFVEETVPVQKIWLDAAETDHGNAAPYEGIDDDILLADMRRVWEMLVESGVSEDEAMVSLSSMEPFNRYPSEIQQLSNAN